MCSYKTSNHQKRDYKLGKLYSEFLTLYKITKELAKFDYYVIITHIKSKPVKDIFVYLRFMMVEKLENIISLGFKIL